MAEQHNAGADRPRPLRKWKVRAGSVLVILAALAVAWLCVDPLLGRLGLARDGWSLYECRELGGSYPVELPRMLGLPRDHRAGTFTSVQSGDRHYIATSITDPAGTDLGTGVWVASGAHGPAAPTYPANDRARAISTISDGSEVTVSDGAIRAAAACAARS